MGHGDRSIWCSDGRVTLLEKYLILIVLHFALVDGRVYREGLFSSDYEICQQLVFRMLDGGCLWSGLLTFKSSTILSWPHWTSFLVINMEITCKDNIIFSNVQNFIFG